MEPIQTTEKEKEIQREMEQTRASLTEKLETLEQKVVGTVEEATAVASQTVESIKETVATVNETVKETVTAVNETVKESVETVKGTVSAVEETVKESVETVKDWFDINAHTQEHPWLVMGGSVAVGYCLGTFFKPISQAASTAVTSMYQTEAPTHHNGGARRQAEQEHAQTKPSWMDRLSEWAPEIDKLKSLALGVLFGTIREVVVQAVPEHIGEQIKDVFDSAAKKVGGKPIPATDFAGMHRSAAEQDQDREENESRQASPHWSTTRQR
jgi:ElaB/YqjD/DUF883 family membrane-anchored ribosome-binding protein